MKIKEENLRSMILEIVSRILNLMIMIKYFKILF